MAEIQAPEGQPKPVKHIGRLAKVIRRIRGHLKSAVSYAGEKDLYSAWKKITQRPQIYLEKLTPASQKESFDR